MTLTYFMARSAEVAYPRSQVSIYRTIGQFGPLFFVVFFFVVVFAMRYTTLSFLYAFHIGLWDA